ncbi:MAG: LysM peptidoglycan-binding domain-containing protein, partial [Syntrophales bacterium]|nr:LysM peptidoglycan-binding domain-containing protein [Syntrophales bacterium]
VDERLDVEKSTRAAIAYLKDLHNMFGDWLTVLAAYNCGEGRVMREIAAQRINYLDRFWDLYHRLPYETARHVPRFLATLLIVKEPEKYGMDLGGAPPLDLPLAYEKVKTNKPMRLQDIAQHLNVSEELLCSLNTELRHKVTPEKEYQLKVPLETAEKFVQVADQIPRWEKPLPTPRTAFINHRVKPGETMASIAKRYGVSPKTIRKYNRLSGKTALRPGQYVKVPIQSRKTVRLAARDAGWERQEGQVQTYRVKKGDTLASIAARYHTTVAELKTLNRLNKTTLKVGQVLRVSAVERAVPEERKKKAAKTQTGKYTPRQDTGQAKRTYVVKKGDTLFKIARSNETTPTRLRELNGLKDGNHTLKVGQIIVLE